MTDLSFRDISHVLKNTSLPPVDLVVGIATGGTVPASLVAFQMDCELELIHINFRHPDNAPAHVEPVLLRPFQLDLPKASRILLVDDVAVSGKTLDFAKKFLTDYQVTTLVMKGKGDIALFPDISTCVNWPWKLPK